MLCKQKLQSLKSVGNLVDRLYEAGDAIMWRQPSLHKVSKGTVRAFVASSSCYAVEEKHTKKTVYVVQEWIIEKKL